MSIKAVNFWENNGKVIKAMSPLPERKIEPIPEKNETERILEKVNAMTKAELISFMKSEEISMLEVMVAKAVVKAASEGDYSALNTLLKNK